MKKINFLKTSNAKGLSLNSDFYANGRFVNFCCVDEDGEYARDELCFDLQDQDELEALENLHKHIQEKIKEFKEGRETVVCGACECVNRVIETNLIVDQFYVSPKGCTEGDYWMDNNHFFFCKKCKMFNRILYHTEADQSYFKQNLKYIFKTTKRISDWNHVAERFRNTTYRKPE